MSALVLDTGALVAVDRDDRAMMARLRAAQQRGLELRSNAMVVAQVWRDRYGRQASLARLLRAVDVRSISEHDGREAGALLAATGTADPIDATIVLLAAPGDRILTSDPQDLTLLAAAARNRASHHSLLTRTIAQPAAEPDVVHAQRRCKTCGLAC